MTSKRFLAYFAMGLAAVATVTISFNLYMDIFGLFRSARSRTISVYGEERIAKYLHSFRYIPENFDGVLLGSSVSDNLDTRILSGYRIYNASIDGGNVLDLKPLEENIYHKRDLRLTIICIHRYLTNDHNKRTDFMTPKQYWGALGSPQLLTAYVSRMAIQRGLVRGLYNDFGTLNIGNDTDSNSARERIQQTVADIRRGTAAIGNYYVDPAALADLGDIVDTARRHSEKLMIFYPPTPAPVLSVSSADFARYRETINALTQPGDIVVDFNSPAYEDFRTDYANFVDGVHLSKQGADAVTSELGRIVRQPGLEGRQRLHPWTTPR